MTIDINSKKPYPADALSNFACYSFEFRKVACRSMEGLLQSTKFQDADIQKDVCLLTGKAAKERGLTTDWRKSQTLWWQGVPMPRDSQTYQAFIEEAFVALYTQNAEARRALLDTGEEDLIHSIGVTDASETILTEAEFCGQLMKLRQRLRP